MVFDKLGKLVRKGTLRLKKENDIEKVTQNNVTTVTTRKRILSRDSAARIIQKVWKGYKGIIVSSLV